MKKPVTEKFSFTITVIDRAGDGKRLECRNGHEVGDTYTCEFSRKYLVPRKGKRTLWLLQ
jgi:hypothetical protein